MKPPRATSDERRATKCIAFLLALVMIGCRPDHEVSYNADVRPIFNQNCLACHGGVKKNADFSLLFEEEAFDTTESGRTAIVPGRPGRSELIRRITHADPEERMPPEEPPLSEGEIQTLRQWIEQGAQWETHWAYIPPEQPSLPEVSDEAWVRNEIDRFVLARLDDEGLPPSAEADCAVLMRRVSLDLVGLPPELDEVDNFCADPSGAAYEQVVDRLLDSPRFGERWAAMWLDLARYADSQGYQKDRHRSIWKYRDWVIEAFNRDLPFDAFTIEQLAGDMLPEPAQDQLIATAFHRNTMTNDEGGTDDEEFRVVAVLDRVSTTFEVWQGTTMACVQCHAHPYDPIRHEEFYRAYAFFNNTADTDRTDDYPILEPSQTPIMQELPPDSSRITGVFERGNWLVHGDTVQPGVPASFGTLPPDAGTDRLAFARWLVSDENPLTARVAVNRFWQQIFGVGLVRTLEDFGTQGDKPSHPALLDWLAVTFQETDDWSVKQSLKRMVLSATYRQDSGVTPELRERDPHNRLLARGPRRRLTAEQVRDQALAVSGLLSDKMYGPSVMPPQPEGVWNTIRHVMQWQTSEGEDRYRRALYTYWRRSSPYPSLMTFDSPSREFCVSRRVPTNTPLQALVTLNDPVYVETARALAHRIEAESPSDDLDARLTYGYRLALARPPTPQTLETLRTYHDQTLTRYQSDPEALADMQDVDTPEDAALTLTASVLLNLDAFVTKE